MTFEPTTPTQKPQTHHPVACHHSSKHLWKFVFICLIEFHILQEFPLLRKYGFGPLLQWPRDLKVLQPQKTHANTKSTSKLRKHLHQFDRWCCKCSQHKQIKKYFKCWQHNQINNFIYLTFFVWLCCEYLDYVSLFGCVVSICSVCVVKLTK